MSTRARRAMAGFEPRVLPCPGGLGATCDEFGILFVAPQERVWVVFGPIGPTVSTVGDEPLVVPAGVVVYGCYALSDDGQHATWHQVSDPNARYHVLSWDPLLVVPEAAS